MAKITGATGLVFDGETLKNPATGKSYVNGTKIENRATGESYSIKGVDAYSKEALYATLRDESWLPMIEPGENEIYMLMHIYKEESPIAFSVSGEDYCVELGTIKNGKFITDNEKKALCSAGTTYENNLKFEDFGDDMPDGGRQCMIKVSSPSIKRFSISAHSDYTDVSYKCWHIVEMWCNVPDATELDISNSEQEYRNNLQYLSFLKIVGGINHLKKIAVAKLTSLKMILEYEVNKSNNSSAYTMYGRNCRNLIYVPEILFEEGLSLYCAFNACNMRTIKISGCSNVTNMLGNTFSNNSSLEEIIGLDTSSVTTDITISNCYNLKKLEIDTSSMRGAFKADSDYALHSMIFKSSNGNSPTSISVTYTDLARDALCKMFDSLEYTDKAKTITITGARGAGELTESDIDTAVVKGWSVVI